MKCQRQQSKVHSKGKSLIMWPRFDFISLNSHRLVAFSKMSLMFNKRRPSCSNKMAVTILKYIKLSTCSLSFDICVIWSCVPPQLKRKYLPKFQKNICKIYFCLPCIYLSVTVLFTPSASQCFMLSYQVIFILNGLAGFFSPDNGCFHFVISTAVCS